MRYFLLAAIAAVSALADGPRYKLVVDGEKAKVEFLASSKVNIHGELKVNPKEALRGELRIENFKASGEIVVKLDAFETGIGLRDRHMREKYLETAKYPEAKLQVVELLIPRSFAEESFSADAESFAGTLTMREKTVPVNGTVSLKGSKQDLDMKFEFPLKISDFKIDPPTFLGVVMASDVVVTAQIQVKPEKLP